MSIVPRALLSAGVDTECCDAAAAERYFRCRHPHAAECDIAWAAALVGSVAGRRRSASSTETVMGSARRRTAAHSRGRRRAVGLRRSRARDISVDGSTGVRSYEEVLRLHLMGG